MRRNFFAVVALASVILMGSCMNTPQFGKSPIDKIVGAMTIEEKVNLLVGSFDGLYQTSPIHRLGIPSVSIVTTALPVNGNLLQQTWNSELAEMVGYETAVQSKSSGYDCISLPIIQSYNTTLSGMLTTALSRGIQNAGMGTAIILSSEMPDNGLDYVAKELEHWAVILNDTIVPSDWEFEGMVASVMSDDYDNNMSGCDMLIPRSADICEWLLKKIGDGTVSMSQVNSSVTRILSMIEKKSNEIEILERPDNSSLVYDVESEGMVLLKNNGILPLGSDVRKIALYGVCSYSTITSGSTGSDNIEDGLKKKGFKIDPAVAGQYRQYVSVNDNHIQPQSLARQAFRYRADAIVDDVAIITIGRETAESNIVATELELIHDVCESFHAKGKSVILILNSDIPFEMESEIGYPDAILLVGIPGNDAGSVIADLLSGRRNPSGKLVRPEYGFPFGHGLSYTSFSISDLAYVHENGRLNMSVRVTNTGKFAGKKTVIVQISSLNNDLGAQRGKWYSFAKTRQLLPGESQDLSFVVYDYYLPSFPVVFHVDFPASLHNNPYTL